MKFTKFYEQYGKSFRSKRMRLFEAIFPAPARVIDLGGSDWNWQFVRKTYQVTLLNIDFDTLLAGGGFGVVSFRVCADCLLIPFRDLSFDVAFSNSVIEHLSTWERQRAFASEIRRIARWYFVQTPYKYFPIEPHVVAPGVQFLPRNVVPWVTRWLTPRGWLEDNVDQLVDDMKHVRLLTRREMQELFPDATIVVERFCGLVKSLIAVRGPRSVIHSVGTYNEAS